MIPIDWLWCQSDWLWCYKVTGCGFRVVIPIDWLIVMSELSSCDTDWLVVVSELSSCDTDWLVVVSDLSSCDTDWLVVVSELSSCDTDWLVVVSELWYRLTGCGFRVVIPIDCLWYYVVALLFTMFIKYCYLYICLYLWYAIWNK